MSKNLRFIKSAKQMLQIMEKNGEKDSPMYKLYSAWSEGYCLCGRKVVVTNFLETGSGADWILQCGHGPTVISLEDEVSKMGHGSSYSWVGIEPSGKLDVHVEKIGVDLDRERQEITVAKIFCHHFYPMLDNFRNDKQDSPYDVIAESRADNSLEYFQITKLNDQNFWKNLNLNKMVDVVLSDIENLVLEAIKRKVAFDRIEKQKIILLIDAHPGVIHSVGEEIKVSLSDILLNAGFKEIWLVGSIPKTTYKLI